MRSFGDNILHQRLSVFQDRRAHKSTRLEIAADVGIEDFKANAVGKRSLEGRGRRHPGNCEGGGSSFFTGDDGLEKDENGCRRSECGEKDLIDPKVDTRHCEALGRVEGCLNSETHVCKDELDVF